MWRGWWKVARIISAHAEMRGEMSTREEDEERHYYCFAGTFEFVSSPANYHHCSLVNSWESAFGGTE
jgi:hypothetical protein